MHTLYNKNLLTSSSFLQACTNSAVKFVEYDESEVITQKSICENTKIAHGTPLSIDVLTPSSLRKRQIRCGRLKKTLQSKTQKAKARTENDNDRFFTTAESCMTTEDGVKLVARFNKKSVKFVSTLPHITNFLSMLLIDSDTH